MSRPTAAVINRYQAKAYDRLAIIVPKGKKAVVETYAEQHGESVNGLVNRLLMEAIGLTVEQWKAAESEKPD